MKSEKLLAELRSAPKELEQFTVRISSDSALIARGLAEMTGCKLSDLLRRILESFLADLSSEVVKAEGKEALENACELARQKSVARKKKVAVKQDLSSYQDKGWG